MYYAKIYSTTLLPITLHYFVVLIISFNIPSCQGKAVPLLYQDRAHYLIAFRSFW